VLGAEHDTVYADCALQIGFDDQETSDRRAPPVEENGFRGRTGFTGQVIVRTLTNCSNITPVSYVQFIHRGC